MGEKINITGYSNTLLGGDAKGMKKGEKTFPVVKYLPKIFFFIRRLLWKFKFLLCPFVGLYQNNLVNTMKTKLWIKKQNYIFQSDKTLLAVGGRIRTGWLRRIINDGGKNKLNPLMCISREEIICRSVAGDEHKWDKKEREMGLIPSTLKCQRERHFKNKCYRLAFVANP